MYDLLMRFGDILPPFWFPIVVTLGGLALAGYAGGVRGVYVVTVLAVLEVALSFNNAVINAVVLRRLNKFWQLMFLTVGLAVAVFGMRLLFPVLLVAVTAHLPLSAVASLALRNPAEYAAKLMQARPEIAAFGATFLMMLFLDFVLDETKEVHWIGVVERPLARAGRLRPLSVLLVLAGLAGAACILSGSDAPRVLLAGLAGLAVYMFVRGVSRLFAGLGGQQPGRAVVAGSAALVLFLYLEVLDSAFSFDSVVGAFAISTNVLAIALGLSIGAVFMRDITVLLVRKGTLQQYIYLEHGAQYSVGALAVILALGLAYDVPDIVTGLVGAGIIGLSLLSSVRENRQPKSKYRSAKQADRY